MTQEQIAQAEDAERLDAVRALGIARPFNYGNLKNRELHAPDLDMTKEEYKQKGAE